MANIFQRKPEEPVRTEGDDFIPPDTASSGDNGDGGKPKEKKKLPPTTWN